MVRPRRQISHTTSAAVTTMANSLLIGAALLCILSYSLVQVQGFTTPARLPVSLSTTTTTYNNNNNNRLGHASTLLPSSPTALNVWWFGGTESSSDVNQDGDSCELVAVRIERPSSNSRKIMGSITVPTPLADVWAILTDYNRLAVHVPNLVESKIMPSSSSSSLSRGGEMGDGNFRCKLFQKGAQKIAGFEFGASVTMEMTERIVTAAAATSNLDETAHAFVPQERLIEFKCVDSFFFSAFDGEWRAKEQIGPDGQLETVLNYEVDVRPKGPVPVAALEWRIREDVPTNLRAVKKAAMEVGLEGVMASRQRASAPANRRIVNEQSTPRRLQQPVATPVASARSTSREQQLLRQQQPQLQNTNAIRRATVRSPRLANPLVRRNGRPSTILASNEQRVRKNTAISKNDYNTNKNNDDDDKTAGKKKAPFPLKVIWEADETMAAYLGES